MTAKTSITFEGITHEFDGGDCTSCPKDQFSAVIETDTHVYGLDADGWDAAVIEKEDATA